jgi:predicted transcriptional regulator of viral defense system
MRIKWKVGEMAAGQWGLIHWLQLRSLEISEAMISRWVAEGYLQVVLPRVYAVGHWLHSVETDLTAAILYAGPGAMLSHATAVWWRGWTNRRPAAIEVSTPRCCRSRAGIRIHGRRQIEREWHKRLPVTTVSQTLLDYSATQLLGDVRYVLAEADYRRDLDLDDLRRSIGRGRAGSAKLRQAIDHHWPELARTRSPAELAFLLLCEDGGLPRPQVNAKLYGLTVDAYWPELRLAVEIDGTRGHSTERQVARDHGRDLKLRVHGVATRRYAAGQVLYHGDEVLRDLRAAHADALSLYDTDGLAVPVREGRAGAQA